MTMLASALLLLATGAPPSPTPTATPTKAPIAVLTTNPAHRAGTPGVGSLADLAKRIKLRLPAGERKVITNENLKELGAGAELTSASPGQLAGGAMITAPAEDPKKALWQSRYWEALDRVTQLEADVTRLEGEVARLEQEFYAQDDPAQRDGVIKPAWDAALESLRDARAQLEQAREQPDEILDAARRDGALPGWFRESPPPAAEPTASPEEPPPG